MDTLFFNVEVYYEKYKHKLLIQVHLIQVILYGNGDTIKSKRYSNKLSK